MRRRLSVAIVGVVAGALLVAGLGSLVIVHRAEADQTRVQLVDQARTLASQAAEIQRPAVLNLVRRAARLDSADFVLVGPQGRLNGTPPAGLGPTELRPDLLLSGTVVSGVRAGLAYAAVPVPVDPAATAAGSRRSAAALLRVVAAGGAVAVVITRRVPGPAGGGWYFALTAVLTLMVAALVADRLGRRISRPLRQVEEAARRIAGGDLTARVAPGDTGYPELSSLAASINSMTESLARAQGLERQFLMSVSHDLRTPLTSIRGWAEAIADGAAEGATAARVIGEEADRLQRLVQDLLDLAKLDARGFSLHPRPVDLAGTVRSVAQGMRPTLEEAGLSLAVDVPDAPAVARADPDRLAQVVSNLVDNAFKFAGGTVRVRVAGGDGRVAVAVEDDGPGIAPADLGHLFDRLYQSSRPAVRPGGSGLGLTIVKELTEAMGGRVGVDSPVADGAGSRFTVSFPAAGPAPYTVPAGAAVPAS